ncbi:AEC family transporter [Frigidibacter sp. ROC022]|uniref:AEC family transporter n=1 Tax=Frigidibacter sp. ROC022 TaxID=2971796 RepID=UPI00215AAC77|nr:AEC family transporter [Frigidibacter sp. ROC022]MCR8726599.1 AEC family transporter [Frigidibacter sp. ROC022]
MLAVFLKTLPFFLIIGLGWAAGRRRFFTEEATAYLTRFVFYFALSAMLFRFSANLSLGDVLDWSLIGAYLTATLTVYVFATLVALARKVPAAEAAFEAQCAVIGNIGFLGLPMLGLLMGERAIIGIMQMLAVDLIFFSSLIVIIITATREGRITARTLGNVLMGLVENPMIVAIVLGLAWSGLGIPVPTPMEEFLTLLGAAATPGALFAIGASLATKSAVRLEVAGWISFLKLVVHPGAVAIAALWLFDVPRQMAAVMIAAASLPVAGNVYILAAHYGVAPQRVSASILISTALSVVTVSLVLSWVLLW